MVDSAYSSGLKDAFPAIVLHQSSDLTRRLVPNGKNRLRNGSGAFYSHSTSVRSRPMFFPIKLEGSLYYKMLSWPIFRDIHYQL